MHTIGSLFAGVGGFDLGFERAGFATRWQVEIDKAAQSVLRLRFPHAALFSDVREVGAQNLEPVDVLTFGSPCQDLSVAGKRAGLAGGRSGLFHEAARIIRELRDRYGKPDFAIWENVPGAFSSNGGADFAAVVQTMVDLGARDVAWRVVDSQNFGVAQRRRRVFLVADFVGERAEQVLFEPESLRGNIAPGGKARKGASRGAAGGAGGGRQWPAEVASTLNAQYGTKQGLEDQHALNGAPLFVPVWIAGASAGAESHVDLAGTLISHNSQHGGIIAPMDLSYTVTSKWAKGSGGPAGCEHQNLVLQPIAFDTTQITSPANYSRPQAGDPCHPLAAGAHPPAIAFHPTQDPISSVDVSHAVSNGSKSGTATVAVCVTGEVTHALTTTAKHGATEDGTGRGCPIVAQPFSVRRLVPAETEILQGFPQGWTAEGIDAKGVRKPQADGPRYKQMGNAVTVNVAEWIARRVASVIEKP